MGKRLYIAYGSNLNIDQMAQRCPTAKLIGTSEVKDYELIFRGVATIEKKKNSIVPVGVWELEQGDEDSLDIYEGFPHFYKKQNFKINLNGEKVNAMAYIMTRGHLLANPSTYYYEAIYKGYIDNGLDTKILEEAIRRTNELKRCELEQENESRNLMGWW